MTRYQVVVYQVATFMALYGFIQSKQSIYQLIMGGIVATLISYSVFKFFKYQKLLLYISILNILTFFLIITVMVLLNCICMPALAYTLMSYVSIPKSPFSYLTSFIVGSIIIIILSYILLIIFNIIAPNNKYFNLSTLASKFNMTTSSTATATSQNAVSTNSSTPNTNSSTTNNSN
jgi:hypothetical protein